MTHYFPFRSPLAFFAMSAPPKLKRARTDEPAAIPAAVETVLKRLLDRDDVTDVDVRDYALVVEGIFGHGTSVYDFGSRVWLVPAAVVPREAPIDGFYSFRSEHEDCMPPDLLAALTGDTHKLNLGDPHSVAVSLILTWAARTQLSNMIVVESDVNPNPRWLGDSCSC